VIKSLTHNVGAAVAAAAAWGLMLPWVALTAPTRCYQRGAANAADGAASPCHANLALI
jgi:hypothetical protein